MPRMHSIELKDRLPLVLIGKCPVSLIIILDRHDRPDPEPASAALGTIALPLQNPRLLRVGLPGSMTAIILHLGHERLVANILLTDAQNHLMLSSELLESLGDFLGWDLEGLSVLKSPSLGTRMGNVSRIGLANRAGSNANSDKGLRNTIELGTYGPYLFDLVDGVLEWEMAEAEGSVGVGVGVEGHGYVLPLVDVGDALLGIVLEAKDLVAVVVEAGGELVLDALPPCKVGGVLVAVLPHAPPGGQHRRRGGATDLVGRGVARLHEALHHQVVRLPVEGVELGRHMGFRIHHAHRRVRRSRRGHHLVVVVISV